MRRNTQCPLQTLLALVLWMIVLLAIFASCASGRVPGGSPPPPVVHPGVGAFVSWDCDYEQPSIWVNAVYVDDPVVLAGLLAHEAAHLQRMQRTGCAAWWAYYRANSEARLDAEAEGFCAQAMVLHRARRYPTLLAAIEDMSRALAANYGIEISEYGAALAIRRYCG